MGSRNPSRVLYFVYNIWQDAGIRTRVAATVSVGRWATRLLSDCDCEARVILDYFLFWLTKLHGS